MEEKLVVRNIDLGFVRKDNSVSAFFQSRFKLRENVNCASTIFPWRVKLIVTYQWNDLGGLVS